MQGLLAAAFAAWASVVWDLGKSLREDMAKIHTSEQEHERKQSDRDSAVSERLGSLESTAKTNAERIQHLETRVDNAISRSK